MALVVEDGPFRGDENVVLKADVSMPAELKGLLDPRFAPAVAGKLGAGIETEPLAVVKAWLTPSSEASVARVAA